MNTAPVSELWTRAKEERRRAIAQLKIRMGGDTWRYLTVSEQEELIQDMLSRLP